MFGRDGLWDKIALYSQLMRKAGLDSEQISEIAQSLQVVTTTPREGFCLSSPPQSSTEGERKAPLECRVSAFRDGSGVILPQPFLSVLNEGVEHVNPSIASLSLERNSPLWKESGKGSQRLDCGAVLSR